MINYDAIIKGLETVTTTELKSDDVDFAYGVRMIKSQMTTRALWRYYGRELRKKWDRKR